MANPPTQVLPAENPVAIKPRAIAETLAQETLANRSALKRLVDRVRRLPSRALAGRSLTTVLRVKTELGDGVEIALEPTRKRRDALEELTTALELPQRIAERDERQPIRFVDQLQELTSFSRRTPAATAT